MNPAVKPRPMREVCHFLAVASFCLLALVRPAGATDIFWANPADGNWSVAANWTPNQVPGSGDNAFVTTDGTYTVTMDQIVSVQNLSVGGASGTQALAEAGNSLTVQNGAGINAHGVLGLTTAFTGGGTVAGVVNWTGGYIGVGPLVVAPGGQMNLSSAATKSFVTGAILTNYGSIVWSGGELQFQGPATVDNQTGGLFEIQCDQSFGRGSFYNEGTFLKSAGTGVATNGNYFVNSGVLTNSSGTLLFIGQGILDGTIGVGPGATNIFQSDSGSANWTMDGNFYADTGGVNEFAGVNFTFDIGTPNFNGPGTNQFVSGAIYFTVPITNFTLAGGAGLYGTNTVDGVLTWTGGYINSQLTVSPSGTVLLTGPGTKTYAAGVVTNCGMNLWTGGQVVYQNTVPYYNQPGALYDIQCDQFLGTSPFYNAGTFRKSAGTNTSIIYMYFYNTGLVTNQSGTLWFQDAGVMDGVVGAAPGKTIKVDTSQSGQSFTLDGAFYAGSGGTMQFLGQFFFDVGTPNFNGPGNVDFSSASAHFNPGVLITNLTLNGDLEGTNTLVGTLNLTNHGSIGGTLYIASNATMNIFSTAPGVLGYGTLLVNGGTINWLGDKLNIFSAPTIPGEGTVISNLAGGVFDVRCDQYMGEGAFYNAGTFKKTAGSGTATNYMYFVNTGVITNLSGTLLFQDGGVMAGVIGAAPGAAIKFDTIASGQPFTMDAAVFAASGANVTFTGQYFFDLGTPNFTGPGTFDFSGASARFSVPITNLTLQGGLAGTNVVVGTLILTNHGSVGGVLTVAAGANLYINSDAAGVLGYGTLLTNHGRITWTGRKLNIFTAPNLPGEGSEIHNESDGVFDVQCDEIMADCTFYNSGRFVKSAGSGVSQIIVYFLNSGVIEPRSGTLKFGQYYNDRNDLLILLPGSSLKFDIGGPNPGTDFGQISSGYVQLDGTLSLGLTNNFVPNIGDGFPIMNWGVKQGGFAAAAGRDLGSVSNGLYFQPQVPADRSGLLLAARTTNLPPIIAWTNIPDQFAAVGGTAGFVPPAFGVAPRSYQWQFNGTNLPTQTNLSLGLTNIQSSNQGSYCVIITDALNQSKTYCATLTVFSLQTITAQPTNQTVAIGTPVTLRVAASSPSPLVYSYQWRLNGANIPNANGSNYLVTAGAQPSDGGVYDVLVSSAAGTIGSSTATVTVVSPPLAFTDNFPGGFVSGYVFAGSGDNSTATSQPNEPPIIGNPPNHSLWLRWTAPSNGVMNVSTRGSTFDTVLGVYTGTSFADLVAINTDDDSGGFFTSQAFFNAQSNVTYYFSVDGFYGATGQVVLGGVLLTNVPAIPQILSQPQDREVGPGGTAFFTVFAASSNSLSYQWNEGDWLKIPAATNSALAISNASFLDVDTYSVTVTGVDGQSVDSLRATLEIGPSLSFDKLGSLLLAFSRSGHNFRVGTHDFGGSFPSVALGGSGSQLLNNFNSTTEHLEPTNNNAAGGSSRWYLLTPTNTGTMVVNTMGSDIPQTLLSVYTGDSIFTLKVVASDRFSAPDGHSQVTFAAQANTNYLFQVDGVTNSQGNIFLNWGLGVPPSPSSSVLNYLVTNGTAIMLQAGQDNGVTAPVFQWQQNGTNLAGATNATYALPSAQYNQVGSYTVMVSNLVGKVANTIATVSVVSPLGAMLDGTTHPPAVRVTGSAGQGTVLQSSTNFTLWTPVQTNPTPLLPINYLDTNSPARPKGFYRLQPWP